ncbi:DMT family transporter [Salicibibacter cibarius]|uniref:DMT family transporter n=1 Tax=Salicibibacter cibarius TaxID=2743000 RepID=A0A7T6Z261_9BACI|nr:DMT family transporter [Salicibibacter cibarius]QQK75413.1 DMT family transporter [Salicibibacter cibarius]
MTWLFVLFTVLGGAALALQAGINAQIGKQIGTIEASFLAYGVGTIALLVATFVVGKGDFAQISTLPKWNLFIGVLGALYIFIMVLSVPEVGAGTAMIAAILGQVIIGMVLDHFGMFGVEVMPINFQRIAGVLLMGVALYLFYKP